MSMFRKPEGDEKPVEDSTPDGHIETEPIPSPPPPPFSVSTIPQETADAILQDLVDGNAKLMPLAETQTAELEKLQRKVKHLVQERAALTAEVRQLKQLVKQQS